MCTQERDEAALSRLSCVTFGAPLVGDTAFASALQEKLGHKIFHVVNEHDWVSSSMAVIQNMVPMAVWSLYIRVM
jgi:hypothetical protein